MEALARAGMGQLEGEEAKAALEQLAAYYDEEDVDEEAEEEMYEPQTEEELR